MRKIESEPEYVRATLDWCNERRAEKGNEPIEQLPKGRRRDPLSCPCGKATGLEVYGLTYFKERIFGSLPYCVTSFVEAFDNGDLPQYEEAK